MATATQQPASAGPAAAPAVAQAFRAQTQKTIKRPGTVLSAALGTAPVPLQDTQIPPTTLLRCIYLECSLAWTSSNAAAVAYNPDAPLNFFSSVNFHDAQGTSIVGSFDSFTLAMAQKYFGFVNNSDVTSSAVYNASTGTGAGNVTVVFRIPVEVVSRTGVGSQINTDTQSPLVLSLTLNTLGAIFSTAPTSADLGSASVVVSYGGYWNQSGSPNSFPTPAAIGTLNYINWTSYASLLGTSQFNLSNIGLGNSIANILFINRIASSSARDDTSFANPLQIAYRGNVLGQWSETLWKHEMSEAYGFSNATLDGPNGLNKGVYNRWFNDDWTSDPGNSLFYALVNSAVGDAFELTGSFGGSSSPVAVNLYEVINFLAVSGPVSAIEGH
jgi:hypothetical protein